MHELFHPQPASQPNRKKAREIVNAILFAPDYEASLFNVIVNILETHGRTDTAFADAVEQEVEEGWAQHKKDWEADAEMSRASEFDTLDTWLEETLEKAGVLVSICLPNDCEVLDITSENAALSAAEDKIEILEYELAEAQAKIERLTAPPTNKV